MKRIIAFLMLFLMLFSQSVCASSLTENYYKNINTDQIRSGYTNGEWLILGMARSEYKREFEKYYQDICKTLKEKNGEIDRKYTTYSRIVIALNAMGKSPYNVANYNLMAKLSDFNKVTSQGLNGTIYAIIATKSGGYENPECENYLKLLLSRQNKDGSFSLTGDGDIDVTASAIQALSFYSERENVSKSIQRALAWLKGKDSRFVESYAQMLVAYTSVPTLVEKAEIERVYGKILKFKAGNGFKHVLEGEINSMASEQGMYAIVAYERYKNGQTPLYFMKDLKEVNVK